MIKKIFERSASKDRRRTSERRRKRQTINNRLSGMENLEERRLLAVDALDNFELMLNPSGGQTGLVQSVLKQPSGADAFLLQVNYTASTDADMSGDSDDIELTLEFDTNFDGSFDLPGDIPDIILDETAEGLGRLEMNQLTAGGEQVNNAIFVVPTGNFSQAVNVRATLRADTSTDIIASIGSLDGVEQTITPGVSPIVGAPAKATQDGGPMGFFNGSTLATGYAVPTTNLFADAFAVRYIAGTPAGQTATPGGTQVETLDDDSMTLLPALIGGAGSVYDNDPFTWSTSAFYDFSSHLAVEIQMDDAVFEPLLDGGDAPDQVAPVATLPGGYPTLIDPSDGPIHAFPDIAMANVPNYGTGPFFGDDADYSISTVEPADSADALGDDISGATPDDEEGLLSYGNGTVTGIVATPAGPAAAGMFVSQTMGTSTGYVELDIAGVGNGMGANPRPGFVSVFVDWDRSGSFEASETVASNVQVTSNGAVAFPVTIPDSGTLDPGDTIMRIRIHSNLCDENAVPLLATGFANDGEVEDHVVQLVEGTEIHGFKYEDVNGNSIYEAGTDTPLEDVIIQLDSITGVDIFGNPLGNPTRTFSDTTPFGNGTAATDATGQFWFNYLSAGDYFVFERLDLTDTNADTVPDDQQGLDPVTAQLACTSATLVSHRVISLMTPMPPHR